MTKQSEALRLADLLEKAPAHTLEDGTITLYLGGTVVADKAAAELRRLHNEHQRLRLIVPQVLEDLNDKLCDDNERLTAQRDALLAALRDLVQNEGIPHYSYLDKGIGRATATANRWLNARAAIRAVEE